MPRKPKKVVQQILDFKPVQPKTHNQQLFIEAIYNNDITFGLGFAGVGKTHLAAGVAAEMLINKEVERVIITRPAVSTESLGFLPGNMEEKIHPYLLPLYDELAYFLNVNTYLESETIVIAPLAYMRGRTFLNSVIILDEAQNCTYTQLKLILTRIGHNSKIIVTADPTQIDLWDGKSGLSRCVGQMYMLENQGVQVVQFTKEDCSIRHPMVEKLLTVMD